MTIALCGTTHVTYHTAQVRCNKAVKMSIAQAEECARRSHFALLNLIMKILVRRVHYALDEVLFDFNAADPAQGKKRALPCVA